MGIRTDLLVTEEIVDSSDLRATPFEFERAKRVEAALSILEGKWKIVILNRLFARPVWRFSELEHAVPGISQRMLSQQLRTLEKNGLVKRTVHPEFPPKVEYELTELGKTLCQAMKSLVDWAMKFPRTREIFEEESRKDLAASRVKSPRKGGKRAKRRSSSNLSLASTQKPLP